MAVKSQTETSDNTNSEMLTTLTAPPYLKPGDTVAIVAPSGLLKNRYREIEQAKSLLKEWGLHAIVGEHVFSKSGHFAGTDEQRASDLQQAMDNPNVKAIWCARGGYGTVRVLDLLDYSKFRAQPKWLIGYSDITALHNDIHNLGIETIHALMCTSLTADITEVETAISSFRKGIFGEDIGYSIVGSSFNKPGTASGQIVGGNLTLLHTMLGSRSSIHTDGKILFFEEIGEYEYHIDRMLQSMKRAGYFKNLKGVVVGSISKVRENTTPWGKPVEQLIRDVFDEYNIPILFDFPAGHEKDNRALILGRTITMDVGKETSTLTFKN